MHIMLSNGTTQAGSGPAPSPFIRFRAVQEEPSVLLVDDDPDIAPLVIAALSPFQIRVEAVTCGADALARLEHRSYDLLILDLGLADLHGYDILRYLKSQPRLSHVRVLVLSGDTALEALARSFGHGADDFVKKPFDMRELAIRAYRLLS